MRKLLAVAGLLVIAACAQGGEEAGTADSSAMSESHQMGDSGMMAGDSMQMTSDSMARDTAAGERLQPGHVWVPNGFGARYPKDGTGELESAGVNLNFLTATEDRDPFTGCPQHKYTLCRVEKCA